MSVFSVKSKCDEINFIPNSAVNPRDEQLHSPDVSAIIRRFQRRSVTTAKAPVAAAAPTVAAGAAANEKNIIEPGGIIIVEWLRHRFSVRSFILCCFFRLTDRRSEETGREGEKR